jgi:hypothetical protein
MRIWREANEIEASLNASVWILRILEDRAFSLVDPIITPEDT